MQPIPLLQPSDGSSIIERSERIAMKSAVSAFSAGEVGDASASFHSSVAFSGEPLDVKRGQTRSPYPDIKYSCTRTTSVYKIIQVGGEGFRL